MIDLPPHLASDTYLPRIVATVREAMGGTPSRAFLFGSRATGRARIGSDYDIALDSEQGIERQIRRAMDALETSTIPFMVDLVDLAVADAEFRAKALREGIVLWTE